MIHSNKDIDLVDKDTNKTVWEEWCLEFLGIKAKRNCSSKNHSNKDIDCFRKNNHKNYDSWQIQLSREQGKYSSKRC
jgi:hypothetical protein